MRGLNSILRWGATAAFLSAAIGSAHALPPQEVQEPAGLNLGGTSFFDAVGSTEPGFVFIDYGRLGLNNEFTTSTGASNPFFPHPKLNVINDIPQIIYISPFKLGGGAFGFTSLFPIVGFDSEFNGPVKLKDNGGGFGDVTFGPFYQSAPVIQDGRPVFFYRAEFDTIAPVGKFDPSKDINQGSGFWSINPYLSMTALPTPKIELSARLHYLYNFETARFSDPIPFPGLANGQAGSAAWINFTASYEIMTNLSVGLNGFYFKQFDDNKTNGISLPGTRAQMLYLGPGAHYLIDHHNIINVNLYLPVETENVAQGPQLQFQYIHPF